MVFSEILSGNVITDSTTMKRVFAIVEMRECDTSPVIQFMGELECLDDLDDVNPKENDLYLVKYFDKTKKNRLNDMYIWKSGKWTTPYHIETNFDRLFTRDIINKISTWIEAKVSIEVEEFTKILLDENAQQKEVKFKRFIISCDFTDHPDSQYMRKVKNDLLKEIELTFASLQVVPVNRVDVYFQEMDAMHLDFYKDN